MPASRSGLSGRSEDTMGGNGDRLRRNAAPIRHPLHLGLPDSSFSGAAGLRNWRRGPLCFDRSPGAQPPSVTSPVWSLIRRSHHHTREQHVPPDRHIAYPELVALPCQGPPFPYSRRLLDSHPNIVRSETCHLYARCGHTIALVSERASGSDRLVRRLRRRRPLEAAGWAAVSGYVCAGVSAWRYVQRRRDTWEHVEL
jgi:hypothetical protein